MHLKLSKKEVSRLGLPALTAADPQRSLGIPSTAAPNRRPAKKPKKLPTVTMEELVARVEADRKSQQLVVVPAEPVVYPEWVEVVLNGMNAVPKERQRFGGGFVYTSDRTRAYEARLRRLGQQVMGNRPVLMGPIETDIEIRFPIPKSWPKTAQEEARTGIRVPTRKADWDNLAKAATDSLNQIVYDDDSQITKACISKIYADIPGITIRFRQIPSVIGGWKK